MNTIQMSQTMEKPDWEYYKAHKEDIDKDAVRWMETGELAAMGCPEGLHMETYARGIVTILHKNPNANNCRGDGKPMTNSEKRAWKRFDRNREPDEVVEVELTEDQYKIIPKEEYVQPPNAPYYKGKEKMPEGWVPIEMIDATTDGRVMAKEANKLSLEK